MLSGVGLRFREDAVEGLGGVRLKPSEDVGVCVERDVHTGMAEPLADDLQIHALAEQEGGVGMPQVMDAESGTLPLR